MIFPLSSPPPHKVHTSFRLRLREDRRTLMISKPHTLLSGPSSPYRLLSAGRCSSGHSSEPQGGAGGSPLPATPCSGDLRLPAGPGLEGRGHSLPGAQLGHKLSPSSLPQRRPSIIQEAITYVVN